MTANKRKIIYSLIYSIIICFLFSGCNNYEKKEAVSEVVVSDSQDIKDEEEKVLNVLSPEKEDNIVEKKEDVEFVDRTEKEEEYKCAMYVRCDEILNNLDKLDKSKHSLIPEDGIIYMSEEIVFQEGETAFDLLLREMKNNKIHLEFEYTPEFKSTYVEGIGNIYEFDCGDMSGWIYKVNGEISSYGCSQYILKNGDVIEWIYIC